VTGGSGWKERALKEEKNRKEGLSKDGSIIYVSTKGLLTAKERKLKGGIGFHGEHDPDPQKNPGGGGGGEGWCALKKRGQGW